MNSFFKHFTFTKNEAKVLIFFSVVIISGLCFKYFGILHGSTGNIKFDYTESDRKFKDIQSNNNPVLFQSNLIIDSSINSLNSDSAKISRIQVEDEKFKDVNGKKRGKKEQNLKDKSININSATKDKLILLPGIGESTAEKIIKFRDLHGNFKKIQDIMKVKGIGKKKFEKMKDFIITE